MTGLLSKTKHFIKLENTLKLRIRSFPYPPFNDYELVDIDPNIIIKEQPDGGNLLVQEGGSLFYTKHFYFSK